MAQKLVEVKIDIPSSPWLNAMKSMTDEETVDLELDAVCLLVERGGTKRLDDAWRAWGELSTAERVQAREEVLSQRAAQRG